MAERLGDRQALLAARNNRACTLRQLGRHQEAFDEFVDTLPMILADDVPDALLTSVEDFACVLFDMGRDRHGALLLGAAVAEREAVGVPRMAFQEAELEPSVATGRPGSATSGRPCSSAAPSSACWPRWRRAIRRGRLIGVSRDPLQRHPVAVDPWPAITSTAYGVTTEVCRNSSGRCFGSLMCTSTSGAVSWAQASKSA